MPHVFDYHDAGNKKITFIVDTGTTLLTFIHDAWNRLTNFWNVNGGRNETYA